MPNLAQAKKALRQSIVRAERNKIVLAEIESMRKKLVKLLSAKKLDEAKELMKTLYKKLDKSVTKKVHKANTVARMKSRDMARLNKAMSAK